MTGMNATTPTTGMIEVQQQQQQPGGGTGGGGSPMAIMQQQAYYAPQQQQFTPPPPPLQQIHQQQQQIQQPMSTPWTLGSTDGQYAISLAMMQHQAAEAALANYNNSNNNATRSTSPTSNTSTASRSIGGGGGQPITIVGADAGSAMSSSSQGDNHSGQHRLQQQQHRQQNRLSAAETTTAAAAAAALLESTQMTLQALHGKQSLYQDLLFRQPSASVESVLAAACEVLSFDIAEMWLRTGPKTHQLTNSHLRPTALDDSTRKDLVDVYYGGKSSERTHRLSPALCKRAKEANDVVWVSAHTPYGAEALRCSISNVRTAVAIPICHEASNTNITIIFFSIRRVLVRPSSVEFLVHMALAAGVASVNTLSDNEQQQQHLANGSMMDNNDNVVATAAASAAAAAAAAAGTRSEHLGGGGGGRGINSASGGGASRSATGGGSGSGSSGGGAKILTSSCIPIRHQRVEHFSITGAELDLQWRQLQNVEYLTDGGNSWIHTAVFQGRPVVVKTLKPECQDVALAINEIEGELAIHSRLNHVNIVSLIGAGTTSKGVRFVILERLDGGTLAQMLGYESRIRDRRRRFWRRKRFSFLDVLRIARSIAQAMNYCHRDAIPGCILLHRDLKPDNIGFMLDGTVKLIDFGLARIVESASVDSHDVYAMSGETGSLRYMAPEVADGLPYNWAADVYSFGIILWELAAGKKPFEGLNRELFYERVVHGGERPHLKHNKWPEALTSVMTECWDADMTNRPTFENIVQRIDAMLDREKGGSGILGTSGSRGGGGGSGGGGGDAAHGPKKSIQKRISGMIDRHSTWF